MAITSFYLLNMFPQMRTLHHHLTINTQHPSQTCSPRCALYIITEQSTPNTQTKHVPPDAHFTPSPNNQHPTPKPNMFLQMRTLHHHLTINTQHLSQTCSLGCALYIITHHPTAKHVPSNAHFTSSPNNHHPSPNSQTCSLRCALYHHHPTTNNQQP